MGFLIIFYDVAFMHGLNLKKLVSIIIKMSNKYEWQKQIKIQLKSYLSYFYPYNFDIGPFNASWWLYKLTS